MDCQDKPLSPSWLKSRHIPTLKGKDCEVCLKKDAGLRCSACQCVHYCSREHQASDRPNHETSCAVIKKFRLRYEHHEEVLSRDMDHGLVTPGNRDNLFQTGAGHFWGILETRPYMSARFRLVDATLERFRARRHVLQAALGHLLDMLRLCRGDNMGVRDIVPSLYLSLGREQEAYDFIKWYATTGNDANYDWGNMDLPYLDVKNADVTVPWPTNKKWLNLTHSSTVILVKMRILHDLQAAQNATIALQGVVPQEIIGLIRNHLVSTNVQLRPELLMASPDAASRVIETLKGQLKDLCKAVDKYNPHFWLYMLDEPGEAAANKPSGYSIRTPEEAQLFIGHNLCAWEETLGAFDTLNAIYEAIHFHPS
ncbi:hypothetical protein B0J13DRAFT_143167 [Dactylonectria estremocensis]|uniref:MYND-type domain-containing protein n=1 Tax=Dactylonectria estremocensis TaxID=1079267 RepID=A0A9P9IQZ7_9HYPO|nr:hypothetical protein B0J13DRAFT_143167 [Dactylonectria estremocensis]